MDYRVLIFSCSTDATLVTDFGFVNGTGSKVSSTIYAFRFFHSAFVTFECDVRVCPSGAAECTIVSMIPHPVQFVGLMNLTKV